MISKIQQLALFLISCTFLSSAFATPARILIIRHAEKPSGNSDDLSAAGYQRAQALAGLFTDQPDLAKYGTPVALFAAAYEVGKSANRCIETLTPLSQALEIPLQDNLKASNEQALVKEILTNTNYDGKMVMIAYPHGDIPTLATTLGVTNAPNNWPSAVFDRIWVLDYQSNGDILFSDLPQRLMPGDSQN